MYCGGNEFRNIPLIEQNISHNRRRNMRECRIGNDEDGFDLRSHGIIHLCDGAFEFEIG